MNKRLDGIRHWLEENNIDAAIISKQPNIYYLSGFTGGEDALLIIDSTSMYILTDGRYFEQVSAECPSAVLWAHSGADLPASLAGYAGGYRRAAVESSHLSHDFFLRLQNTLPAELVPAREIVENLRQVKDDNELACLRKSGELGDQALQKSLERLGPESTERETAAYLEYQLKRLGSSGPSFDTIVLFGASSALPHGHPGDDRLQTGRPALFDFGGYYNHYTADMSRTFGYGQPDREFEKRYAAVLEAQEAGIAAVKAGVQAREVHMTVKQVLAGYGLDRYFVHGTGHGIGLEIHENPRVSERSEAILESGMVITIEPGIYIPGWGGIRIEDSVIVTGQGCERITRSDRQLNYITEG